MLDADELFHLAVQEMQGGSTEKAITYLKDCLNQNADNAQAQYLLGALHAELGMYERATQEMELALKIDPNMPTARFQLGLLYITSGNIEKSAETWHDLVDLGLDHPLYLFKNGMLDFTNDQFEDCITKLEQGISLNTENEPLNNDMLKVITQSKAALDRSAPLSNKPETIAETEEHKKVISLSAYGSQDEDELDNNH